MAASILNLSKTGATINPSIVDNILECAVSVSLEIDSLGSYSSKGIVAVRDAPGVTATKRVNIAELEELGTRLSSIYNFEETMDKAIKDSSNVDKELFHYMRYDSKNGLKVVVDLQLYSCYRYVIHLYHHDETLLLG